MSWIAASSERKDLTMPFEIKSSAFGQNQAIPKKYTCDGSDISVPLTWIDPPQGTSSFAIIADDPDAPRGTWVHWVIYDVPATARDLSEGIAAREKLDNGSKQGKNDFGKIGYGGPCPPAGPAHRYHFKLYALDRMTGLSTGASKQQLLDAMKGHTLAQAELIGTYKR
jgi:Raf kinase inhibitor-like YbhB/YbcL family protein